jgi:hypothetical protein
VSRVRESWPPGLGAPCRLFHGCPILSQPEFEDARSFSEGVAIVWWNDECGYIDKTGTVVIPIDYQIAGFDFSGGVACVSYGYGGSPSYIGKTGKVIWQGD